MLLLLWIAVAISTLWNPAYILLSLRRLLCLLLPYTLLPPLPLQPLLPLPCLLLAPQSCRLLFPLLGRVLLASLR